MVGTGVDANVQTLNEEHMQAIARCCTRAVRDTSSVASALTQYRDSGLQRADSVTESTLIDCSHIGSNRHLKALVVRIRFLEHPQMSDSCISPVFGVDDVLGTCARFRLYWKILAHSRARLQCCSLL